MSCVSPHSVVHESSSFAAVQVVKCMVLNVYTCTFVQKIYAFGGEKQHFLVLPHPFQFHRLLVPVRRGVSTHDTRLEVLRIQHQAFINSST
jgi:hypothetical protein